MSYLRLGLARLRGLFAGTREDQDLREELESHLEMETAELIRRGMDPETARRQARIASGGVTQAAEAVREQRGLPWIENAVADLRYGIRSLRRNPGFTAVVVITLALGIGATTAIFSVVRAVLLKPLPHRDGDRLVYLRQSTDALGGENMLFSVPEIRDLRSGAPAFTYIAEYSPWDAVLRGEADVATVQVGLVTGNFFDVMGLSPVVGRLTRASDDGPGVPPVTVLTHEFWIRRFGADSSIVGRQLLMNGQSVTVIGVLQPAPLFPDQVDCFTNMVFSEHHLSATMVEGRTHRMTELIGRLKPSATLAEARTEITTVHERLKRQYPDAYDPGSNYRISVIPFKQAIGQRAQLTLWLLIGVAGFILVISAANVTSLTLMRGVRRGHELVVRTALGAASGRLRRLLLVENLLLALIGAALGLVIALGGLELLVRLVARYSPRAAEIQLDRTVLGFTLGLSVAIALLLSFAASLPRDDAEGVLVSAGANRHTGTPGKQRVQRGLVVAQIAVSVVLLAGAGLLTRTMMELSAVNTGLRTEEVLTIPVPFRATDSTAEAAAKQRLGEMADGIRALPGVVDVGIGSEVPLTTSLLNLELKVEGKPLSAGQAIPRAEGRNADPHYFRAAGIPLLQGREFTTADRTGSGQVAIINQALADILFPGESPIDRRIAWTGDVLRFAPVNGEWRTVVGVVGNTHDGGLDAAPPAVMYMPFAQEFNYAGGLAVRADSNVSALAGAATRIVRELAPGIPIEKVMTVAQIKEQSVTPRRLNAVLVWSFGLLALIIAAVGIAGVLAFSVSMRINEIGVRMSLGAAPGQVQRMILGEGGVLLGIGLVMGLLGALLSARAIQGLLFGVAPYDPATFGAVAVIMAVIGIGACWIPALRASRVDPVITLRAQ
ncbi:MAG TPA: ABC transporter permease [Gemmatimonadales bacterium]|nr:ABC transporter permease [Gemmatimonadales bacterium]